MSHNHMKSSLILKPRFNEMLNNKIYYGFMFTKLKSKVHE